MREMEMEVIEMGMEIKMEVGCGWRGVMGMEMNEMRTETSKLGMNQIGKGLSEMEMSEPSTHRPGKLPASPAEPAGCSGGTEPRSPSLHLAAGPARDSPSAGSGVAASGCARVSPPCRGLIFLRPFPSALKSPFIPCGPSSAVKSPPHCPLHATPCWRLLCPRAEDAGLWGLCFSRSLGLSFPTSDPRPRASVSPPAAPPPAGRMSELGAQLRGPTGTPCPVPSRCHSFPLPAAASPGGFAAPETVGLFLAAFPAAALRVPAALCEGLSAQETALALLPLHTRGPPYSQSCPPALPASHPMARH